MDGGMMMSDIMFEHLTKTYPNGFISVDDVTLKIQDGEFVVFHGPSGCGKSTILRMIGGLEDITSGKIYLGDELLNDILPRDRKLAMAFQNYLLYKYLNVYENMALGLRLRDFPRNVIDNRVNTAAQFLGISAILHEKIKNISDDTFRRLYGREIPDGSWSGEIRMNDAVCQLYYGKGIFGKLFYGVLRILLKISEWQGKPNLNVLFNYNMPIRGYAKMTGGFVTMEMAEALTEMANGHRIRGTAHLIKAAVKRD